jgi:hypothetical protein
MFERRTPLDPTDPAVPLEAYKEGRRDERRQIEAGAVDHRLVKKELDDSYERGVRAGLARRRGSVLGALSFAVLLVLVIATGAMVAVYGSFEGVGVAIDRTLASI